MGALRGGEMQRSTIFRAAAISTVLLTACGGGSDSPAPAPVPAPAPAPAPPPPAGTAEGLYLGTTNTNRTVNGIVLDDGSFYVLYSTVANPVVIAGVVQGNGTSMNGSFSSTNARDFNLEGLGVLPGTVSASYNSRQSLNGSISYNSGGTTTFTSTFNAAYDTVPTLAAISGTYAGQVAFSQGVENANVTISPTGTLSGTGASGCTVSGNVVPRTQGNVYNLTLTFGGAPCFFANQTMTGVAYYDSVAKRVYGATPTAARTDGILFVGVKP